MNTSSGIVAGIGGAAFAPDNVILAALIGMSTGAEVAVQNCLAAKLKADTRNQK